jgi:diguanylate cyclase (GGDEF)-like protein
MFVESRYWVKGDKNLGKVSKESVWYQWLVGIAGTATALYYLPEVLDHHLLAILLLTIMAALLEAFPVTIDQVRATLTVAVLLAALVVYGDGASIWVIFLGTLLSKIVYRRKSSISNEIFNAGQYALSALAMDISFHIFHPRTVVLFGWQLFWSIGAASIVYIVINNMLVHSMRYLWGYFEFRQAMRFTALDALNSMIALPFALLMIFVSPLHPWLAPASTLPIILLARSMAVHQKTKELQGVFRVASNLASEFDTNRICSEVLTVTRRLSGADTAAVFLIDQKLNRLVPAAVWPQSAYEQFRDLEMKESDGGVIWHTIYTRKEKYIIDTRKEPLVTGDCEKDEHWYLSMAVYPMLAHGEVKGAIVCYGNRTYAFSYIREYMITLASQASVLLENAGLYQELQERSLHDGATGLFNYRYFYEVLEQRVNLALEENRPVSVAILDIDFFKKFNDTYGHLAGDEVLRSLGRLLREIAGPDAIVARYGGEEFALILPMDANEAFEVVERIRIITSNHVVDYQGYQLQGITFSSGIASCPEHSANDRDLILKADSTMYWGAKQRGRNRTALYTPEYDAQLFIDEMTELYTFHFVDIQIREEIALGTRTWGVIGINLTRFRQINDTFGFEVGDKVLRQIGMRIKESLRQGELACRYGGDEILVLLPNVDPAELNTIAERLSKSVSNHRYTLNANIIISIKGRFIAQAYTNVQDPGELFDYFGRLFTNLKHDSNNSLLGTYS